MTSTAIPTAAGMRFFDHAHLFRGEARLPFLEQIARTGDLVRVRLVYRWFYFLSGPTTVHELLVDQARNVEKSPGMRLLLHDLLGQGLLNSEGDLWKRQRRLISPLFQPKRLAGYVGLMNEEARRVRERLVDGARVDLAHEMMRIAMNVIARAMFGAQTDGATEEIGDALTTMLGWVNDHMATPSIRLQLSVMDGLDALKGKLPERLERTRARIRAMLDEPVLMPGRKDPRLVQARELFNQRLYGMIRDRRAPVTDRQDLLTRLLLARDGEHAGDGMSNQQARDEVATFFIAGHETTATALAWAFYLLAKNPDARARVQAEADSFGPEGPTSFDPEKLAYTTRVFKEALRLYPPIMFFARRALEPVTIAGRQLPKNSIFVVNVYGQHRKDDVWPDPLRFDPDRFEPAAEAGRHRSAWIPFGAGPRVCIGNFFALMEGPVVLATMMHGLRYEVEPGVVEPGVLMTLRPKDGIFARVRRGTRA